MLIALGRCDVAGAVTLRRWSARRDLNRSFFNFDHYSNAGAKILVARGLWTHNLKTLHFSPYFRSFCVLSLNFVQVPINNNNAHK